MGERKRVKSSQFKKNRADSGTTVRSFSIESDLLNNPEELLRWVSESRSSGDSPNFGSDEVVLSKRPTQPEEKQQLAPELAGLLYGIACDGRVNIQEARMLKRWLEQFEIEGDQVSCEIYSLLERVLEDNIVTASEEAEMLELFNCLTGCDYQESAGETNSYSPPAAQAIKSPVRLDEYYGQGRIKEALNQLAEEADKNGERISSFLFAGDQGMGKTTLLFLFFGARGVRVYSHKGRSFKQESDLASLLIDMEDGEVLLIENIEELLAAPARLLASVIANGKAEVKIGSGKNARSICLDFPDVTIACTASDLSSVDACLHSAFQTVLKMDDYTSAELSKLAYSLAERAGVALSPDTTLLVVEQAGGKPGAVYSAVRMLLEEEIAR